MIVFFTQRLVDGSGDVSQTAKIAHHLEQNLAEKYGITEEIVIVTPNPPPEGSNRSNRLNQHQWVTNFYRGMYPDSNIKIITMNDYQQIDQSLIDCHMNAGLLIDSSNDFSPEETALINAIRIAGDAKPYITFPEYSQIQSSGTNRVVRSGFRSYEHGVIPNQKLLDATKDPEKLEIIKEEAFTKLTPELKNYICHDYDNYTDYHSQTGFSYAYFHDRTIDPGTNKCTTEFFLEKQIPFLKNSQKSQDVICIGAEKEYKHLALEHQISALKQMGFNEIIFVDVDSGQEEVLYSSEDRTDKKTYRMLCVQHVPYACMELLPLLSDNLVGVTGDNSLVEAMSAGKIFAYERMRHKDLFMNGYLNKVRDLTKDIRVYELADYLVNGYGANLEKVTEYAQNPEIVNTLKSINRQLIAESQYLNEVEKTVVSTIQQQQLKNKPDDTIFGYFKAKYNSLVQRFSTEEKPENNPSRHNSMKK